MSPVVDFHVVPVGDLREHVEATGTCWCGPQALAVVSDAGQPCRIWTHHAADGREHFEPDHRACAGCGRVRVN